MKKIVLYWSASFFDLSPLSFAYGRNEKEWKKLLSLLFEFPGLQRVTSRKGFFPICI